MQAFKYFITWALILAIYYAPAQATTVNKYGLSVIKSKKELIKLAERDSLKKMMELKQLIPSLVYDLRYSTTNNFMGRRMYPKKTAETFLRLPAAAALEKVQQELNDKGFGLKIWDAYRPYSVTEAFWDLVKDDRYVADPKKGSGHNRGIAVDLTIIKLDNGEELPMGTGFDNFSDTAHHVFNQLPETILKNRQLLKQTMEKHGFNSFSSEWWHYSFGNAADYELLDLSFETMKKIASSLINK